jgi:hypothetical protein
VVTARPWYSCVMRRRSALPAMFAVMLLVVGQLVALAHEAAQRHITCAEHGEQLEAVVLASALHACEDDHFVAVDGGGGDHADCPIARMLRQSSDAPSHGLVSRSAVVECTECSAPACRLRIVADPLFLIAPKTSPPV